MTQTLDSVLATISSQNGEEFHPKGIVNMFSAIIKRDESEALLNSMLENGQDPLQALSAAASTIPYLFILSSRLSTAGSQPVHPDFITVYCETFDPVAARYSPERITRLAKGIVMFAESILNPSFALGPLHNLVTRYPPSPQFLTTIHPLFILTCIQTRHFTSALPLISPPVSEVDRMLSDLDYTDVLQYHYLAGIVFAALKMYQDAEGAFELAATAPANASSALQLEAYKKLILIQLIRHGKVLPLPKYAHVGLSKHIKNSPIYATLTKQYPTIRGQLQEVFIKEIESVREEGNAGLLHIALARAPRWTLKNLMNTYLSLPLKQVVSSTDLASEAEAKELILSMIEEGELSATLSPDGILTFTEDSNADAFHPKAIENVFHRAQISGTCLEELNQKILKSKELLAKALREKESGTAFGIGGSFDEEGDLFSPRGARVDGLFDE